MEYVGDWAAHWKVSGLYCDHITHYRLICTGNESVASPAPPRYEQSRVGSEKISMVVYTSLIGTYEATLKEPVSCDGVPFFAYTDRPDLQASDAAGFWLPQERSCWQIVPNALELATSLDVTHGQWNSIDHESGLFNLAKFFKLNPCRLPQLSGFEFVVWLDGSIRIQADLRQQLLPLLRSMDQVVALFEHDPGRQGLVEREVQVSIPYSKYLYPPAWLQRPQDIQGAWESYLREGFVEKWWTDPVLGAQAHALPSYSDRFGMWITAFVPWRMNHPLASQLCHEWWAENAAHITQDQVTLPIMFWRLRTLPFPLPNEQLGIAGDAYNNALYVKQDHGQRLM